MRRPELADLVAQLGPDHPVCRTVVNLDAYTGAELPEPRLTPIDTPDGSSYFSDLPNPARGGKSPPLYAFTDEGGFGLEYGPMSGAEDTTPDIHRVAQMKMYARLKRERELKRNEPK